MAGANPPEDDGSFHRGPRRGVRPGVRPIAPVPVGEVLPACDRRADRRADVGAAGGIAGSSSRITQAVQTDPAAASSQARDSSRPAARQAQDTRRWLDKLDAGIPKVSEAYIARKEGNAGGIPVRHWTNEGPANPGDFAPAVAPERTAAMGKHLEELEGRLRRSGRPVVGFGKETEASMMFGGTGETAGEPIPAWIRDMIRKRVRDYLPELEGVYTDAIRRNPDLRGKLLVRFRIDPVGNDPARRVGGYVRPRHRVRERRPRKGPSLDVRADRGAGGGGSLPVRLRRPFVKGQNTPGISR